MSVGSQIGQSICLPVILLNNYSWKGWKVEGQNRSENVVKRKMLLKSSTVLKGKTGDIKIDLSSQINLQYQRSEHLR